MSCSFESPTDGRVRSSNELRKRGGRGWEVIQQRGFVRLDSLGQAIGLTMWLNQS